MAIQGIWLGEDNIGTGALALDPFNKLLIEMEMRNPNEILAGTPIRITVSGFSNPYSVLPVSGFQLILRDNLDGV